VAVPTDQNKRKRAAKRRQREDALRLELAVAIANRRRPRRRPPRSASTSSRERPGAPHATVARWIRDGVIKSVKVGRRRLIAFSEIARIKGQF
jgi:excisionase family DNA binding protein